MNTNQDTTLTTYDKFEAWFEENYPLGNKTKNRDKNSAYEGYQASTKASESEINSLKERVVELQSHLSSQSIELSHNDVTLESYAHKVAELKADNNRLREALREIRSCYGDGYEVDNIARQALSKTPAQSLQEHDNEVIERCAVVCESLKEQDYCVDVRAGAESIRALKVTP